jgi:autotransporter-associated beta strand protein
MFVFSGGTVRGHGGAGADFRDSSNAANATLIVEAGTVAGAYGGSIAFDDSQVSAGNATIIANGATVAGGLGGQVTFFNSTPSEPTLIGNGGVNGGTGGVFLFFEDIPGNLAHVQLNGDALLDISLTGGATIGSLSGDGAVDLGDFTLTVGGNNQSTLFSGLIDQINTEGGYGALRKIGSGTLRLSHDNMFKGGITVTEGTLLIGNQTGSASGSGGVAVEEGTLGGGGVTAGAVKIGTGSGPGAFLAPGQGARTAEALTIESTVTFKTDSTYTWKFSTKNATADQVIAKGVTIDNGSQFAFAAVGDKKLAPGTGFTAISNTSANPISGTFSNLPDGGNITIGNNTFQASYEGGDGNDLTLTVLP